MEPHNGTLRSLNIISSRTNKYAKLDSTRSVVQGRIRS